ncbi:tetratricopeptide repeat protein [Roseimaritima sediminicola]|uniref:tetratricopeptide repeat protein n=1 Tax=Roseimaritima sediminicola TaxID=2662066 RepID=UPI0012984D6F|nr:hypothetical protein [Roseimaritima sediminicola]
MFYRCVSVGFLLLTLVLVPLGSVAAAAELPGRRSADWQADLISALVDAEMLDSAETICARRFAATDLSSDAAARWAIRWSSVRAARLRLSTQWTEALAEAARQPIERLLQAYPDHARADWLKVQLGIVQLATVQHAALQLAVTPDEPAIQQRGLQYAADALRRWQAVGDRIDQQTPATRPELRDLLQTIRQQRLQTLLWRGRLFAPESESRIASATEAEREAREVLSQTSPDSSAHQQARRIRAEALIAMGRSEDALQWLSADAAAAAGTAESAALLALRIEALLAAGDLQAADQLLRGYFGADPSAVAAPLELQLVRLDYLLRTKPASTSDDGPADPDLDALADWLDVIERQHGVYARRRAEAKTLRVVRVRGDQGDSRLLAAKAGQELRSGNLSAAAALLVQAAEAETEAAAALKYATQAAAVLARIGSSDSWSQAADILQRVSQRHPGHAKAPAAHLQAAYLVAQGMQKTASSDDGRLRQLLQQTVRTWPDSPQASTAIDWLVRLLEAGRQHAAAARWRLSGGATASVETIRRAARLWQTALRENAYDAALLAEAVRSFRTAVTQVDEPPVVAASQAAAARLITLFADLSTLRNASLESVMDTGDPAIAALYRFRRNGLDPATLLPGQGELGTDEDGRQNTLDAVRRLLADGQTEAGQRRRLGQGILRLLDAFADSPSDAQSPAVGQPTRLAELRSRALVWTGQWQQADALWQRRIAESPDDLQVIRRAAEVLGEAEERAGKSRAIEYWTRIAAGLPQGDPAWHDAKLATIGLHLAMGDRTEAAKIARYVLLTRRPSDPETVARYQRVLE